MPKIQNVHCPKFPERCPALISKCCRGPSEDEDIAVSVNSNNVSSSPSSPRIPSSPTSPSFHDHLSSSSVSVGTNASVDAVPDWSRRSSTRHSHIFAHTMRPDDVLSFYADVECHYILYNHPVMPSFNTQIIE